MPENPEVQEEIAKLVARMRESADKLAGQHPLDFDTPKAITDLRQGANCIEDLVKVYETAYAVWEVATRKGMIFVTDPATGSDALIGMFVPAHLMNDLGKALVGHAKAMQAVAR
jgi:hypothetical protein